MKNYKITLVDKRSDAHIYRVRTHRAELEIKISKDGFIGVTDLPQPDYVDFDGGTGIARKALEGET